MELNITGPKTAGLSFDRFYSMPT